MTLSDSLYSQLPKKEANNQNRPRMLWIWWHLLYRENAEVWKKELTELQQFAGGKHHTPQLVLELAWKAEVLEHLLSD